MRHVGGFLEVNSGGQSEVNLRSNEVLNSGKQVLNSGKQVLNSVKPVIEQSEKQSNGRVNLINCK